MSVSPYTVAHDAEVQQYKRLRAATLADMKARKRLEKQTALELGQQKNSGGDAVEREKGGGKMVGRRAGLLWRRVLGRGSAKEEKWEGGFGCEGKVMTVQEGEWEELSDAETEVEMVDVLNDAKGVSAGRSLSEGAERAEGKTAVRTRTERAPPYVFLQAMAGVTVPLRRSGR